MLAGIEIDAGNAFQGMDPQRSGGLKAEDIPFVHTHTRALQLKRWRL